MPVSTLFETALQAVMKYFYCFQNELSYLPPEVKTRVLTCMMKRGLLDEQNALSVSSISVVCGGFSSRVVCTRYSVCLCDHVECYACVPV